MPITLEDIVADYLYDIKLIRGFGRRDEWLAAAYKECGAAGLYEYIISHDDITIYEGMLQYIHMLSDIKRRHPRDRIKWQNVIQGAVDIMEQWEAAYY